MGQDRGVSSFLFVQWAAERGLQSLLGAIVIQITIYQLWRFVLTFLWCFHTTGALNWISLTRCPGFGWDRVNFLLTSWYSAVFWIECENNVDNRLMF